jgi:hypothetical protein
MQEKLAFVLMLKILDLVKDSGANRTEALCAIRGCESMLPDLDLPVKPSMVIETARPL